MQKSLPKVVFRNSEVESLVINAMNENNVEKLKQAAEI